MDSRKEVVNKFELQNQAEKYKYLYKIGECSVDIAKENINPYINFINKIIKEKCKKYNKKYKPICFSYYIRN